MSGKERGEQSGGEVIFYDATCRVCRAAARSVRRADAAAARFQIAPLGGDSFRACVPEGERRELPDSLVVRTGEGRLLVRSDAVLHILSGLGPGAGWLAALLRAVPRPIRDWAYDVFARARRLLPRVSGSEP